MSNYYEFYGKHTKPGYVYLILNLFRWPLKVKIGLSNNPDRRIKELRSVYGWWLFCFIAVETVNMAKLESLAHNRFRQYKSPEPSHKNGYTEWYLVNPLRLFKMVRFLKSKARQLKGF